VPERESLDGEPPNGQDADGQRADADHGEGGCHAREGEL